MNKNDKNLKKIYSDKIDFKNKTIIKYYKLNTKKPEIVHFVKKIIKIFIFMVIIQNV